MPDLRCPNCMTILDAHEALAEDARPNDGDVSLCWRCMAITVFDDNSSVLRRPTPAERARIEASPEYRTAIDIMVTTKSAGGTVFDALSQLRRNP